MHNKTPLWDLASWWRVRICVPVDVHDNAHKCFPYACECVLMWLIARQLHPMSFKFFISRLQWWTREDKQGVQTNALQITRILWCLRHTSTYIYIKYAVKCQKWRDRAQDRQTEQAEGEQKNPWCQLHVSYSLVCLEERQRSEMEKCHLASIRLPLSSPLRSERSGGGTFKKSFKALWASLCLWNHSIIHFYQHWTCKTRTSENSPAKGMPEFPPSFWGQRDVEL